MAKLANVDLTNTFNAWRIRTNDVIYRLNQTMDQLGPRHTVLFANTVTANNVLRAGGNTVLGAAGKLTIVNARLLSNGVLIATNMRSTGNAALGAAGTRTIITGRLTSNGNLAVTGNSVLGGTASASALQTIVNARLVSNGVFVGTNIRTTGNTVLGAAGTRTIVNARFAANNTATIGDLLTVTGNTVIGTISKQAVVNGRLTANGVANVVARFSVVGNTVLGGTFAGGVYTNRSLVNGLLSANGQVEMRMQTLTDTATVTWDSRLGNIAQVTLTANRNMALPTNLRPGTYVLHVRQDGVGGRTLTWNGGYKWPAQTAPTLTTTANARDVFSFISDGILLYGNMSVPDAR